jgi:octaprenyl-diphosphate synthase
MTATLFPSLAPTADFATVFSRLRPHLGELDQFLREQVTHFEPEVRKMADYCIDTSGKRIRPALVFFSGWRADGAVDPALVRVAAVVELVHLATLVHDDIMDEAEVRRGRLTAAREFGPDAAVLLGDALFSHALHLAALFPTTAVCREVSRAVRRVCSGEIIQTLRRRSDSVSRDDYRRVIDLKTAELFRVSCWLGSEQAGNPTPFVQEAADFGRHLGIAYQMYDDLADFYGSEARIGKTLGTDLGGGKLTLPLLVLLDRLQEEEQRELREEVRGEREARPARWLERMREHRVFAAVVEEIEAELRQGADRLAPWSHLPAAGPLGQLGTVLRNQVGSLGSG